jgi:uncharacterized protein YPO0396
MCSSHPRLRAAILLRRFGPEAKAALALLGKAKALKNAGDLNLLVCDDMLDMPATSTPPRR